MLPSLSYTSGPKQKQILTATQALSFIPTTSIIIESPEAAVRPDITTPITQQPSISAPDTETFQIPPSISDPTDILKTQVYSQRPTLTPVSGTFEQLPSTDKILADSRMMEYLPIVLIGGLLFILSRKRN